jgi:hypothetical protein
MASFEFLAIILTGLGLTVSITYYAMVLRNQNQTRQAQLFMQVFNRFQDPGFIKLHNEVMSRDWTSIDDYLEKYGPPDDVVLSVQTYYEGVGVLLMKGMISSDFVYELIPTMVNVLWTKYEPIVLFVRENFNYPQYWRPVEYLKDKMIEEAEKRGDPIILERKQKEERQ